MIISMTGQTFAPQVEVGSGAFLRRFYLDQFRLMAGFAIQGFMLPNQVIASFTVIECLLVKMDNLEISSMVFIMTGITLLACYLG